jgi:hypothetical protein
MVENLHCMIAKRNTIEKPCFAAPDMRKIDSLLQSAGCALEMSARL